MATKGDRKTTETVTVERSGARSVMLGELLKKDRAKEQLSKIQQIQDRQQKRA